MTHTVITLRARSCGIPPRPGDLMAAQTGNAVYRVDAVTTLHQAGERPGTYRYRLTCTLLTSSELIAAYEDSSEEGFEIHPWRWGGHAPRQTALQAVPAKQAAPGTHSGPPKAGLCGATARHDGGH
jgi:hypothetical protein